MVHPVVQLGSKLISQVSKPYIIAEIGVNHEGSINKALELIKLAKDGGADAVKFQSYKANTLASRNSPAYWDLAKEKTKSQFELFMKYDNFNEDDYVRLASFSIDLNIDFLSTPFDDESVEFLEPLIPFYKIASADLTNTPLLRRIAQKEKPVVLSTGASTFDEIDHAISTLSKSGVHQILLLHCILNYPTLDSNAHLHMITSLRNRYPNHLIGYSDHTLPDETMSSLSTAYILGARVLEKHFTFDKSLPGNDHYHSMDINDLIICNKMLDKHYTLLGTIFHKSPILSENIARLNARRSIVLSKDISAGDNFTTNNLTCKRPGTGISPLYWDEIINKVCSKSLPADHILKWDDVSE